MERCIWLKKAEIDSVLNGRITKIIRVMKPQPLRTEMYQFEYVNAPLEEILFFDKNQSAKFDCLINRLPTTRHSIKRMIEWNKTRTPRGFTKQELSKAWYQFTGYVLLVREVFRTPKQVPVKNVRVERLQDITEEDVMSTGISPVPFASGFDDNGLHNLINSKRGYPVESNPFVWVIEFEVVA